tara:strand:+ start:245 stop:619 length:375 start_codon:yes stop_codon:yes gene_type:complete
MARSSNPIKHYASAVYDFAVDGGATSTITPSQTTVIPDNAIITEVCVETLTANTSGGSSTMTINAGGVDITAAMSIADRSVTVPYITVAPKKATSAAAIKCTIATATLTAGKCVITVGYFMSPE